MHISVSVRKLSLATANKHHISSSISLALPGWLELSKHLSICLSVKELSVPFATMALLRVYGKYVKNNSFPEEHSSLKKCITLVHRTTPQFLPHLLKLHSLTQWLTYSPPEPAFTPVSQIHYQNSNFSEPTGSLPVAELHDSIKILLKETHTVLRLACKYAFMHN